MKNVRILAYKDCWAIRAKICIPRGHFQLVFIRLTYYLSRKRANFDLQGSVIDGLLAGLKVAENLRILAYRDRVLMGYEEEKMYFQGTFSTCIQKVAKSSKQLQTGEDS